MILILSFIPTVILLGMPIRFQVHPCHGLGNLLGWEGGGGQSVGPGGRWVARESGGVAWERP
jgi:hypothetical protein